MTASKRLAALVAGAVMSGLAAVSAAQAQTTIEVHNTMNPGGAEEASLMKFKEILEERSDGRFQVQPYLASQLGGEVEVLELLKLGQTQMALTGTTYIAQYADEYDAMNIPFVLPSWESSVAYMDSATGQRIKELSLERGGIRHLALQQRGARHMTSNKEINGPEDVQGLVMRVPPQPAWIAVWEALGAQTVVLPAGDIYLAMRTGQIGAHENTLASPYSRKLWEVQDYIVLTGHLYNPWSYVASESWLQTLSEEDQALVLEAAQEAAEYGGQVAVERQQFYIDELEKEGMTILEVDTGAFYAAARDVIDGLLDEKAEGVKQDALDAVESTGGAAE